MTPHLFLVAELLNPLPLASIVNLKHGESKIQLELFVFVMMKVLGMLLGHALCFKAILTAWF